MKKLTITILAITFLGVGTAFGANLKKIIEVYKNDYTAIVYIGSSDVKLYKVVDGNVTCYIGTQIVNNGGTNVHSQTLSCVK